MKEVICDLRFDSHLARLAYSALFSSQSYYNHIYLDSLWAKFRKKIVAAFELLYKTGGF